MDILPGSIADELRAAGWGNFSAHPVHPGLVAEHGRLLRLALYHRRPDDLWVARIGIQGAQLIAVEHADPRVAFNSAHEEAVRVLRETTATLCQLGLPVSGKAATSGEVQPT